MLERIDHDGLLELRLARPPVNALDPDLIVALAEAVRTAPEEGARAVILSGRPGLFSAGLDVPAFLALDRAAVSDAWRAFFELCSRLAHSDVPVAAALTGHAPAGGCVLALFTEYRVLAAGKSKMGLNEVAVGLHMPWVIHEAARFVAGSRNAQRISTTGKLWSAEEALALGLVDELAAEEDVLERALDWAREQLALPPIAARWARDVARGPLWAALDAREEFDPHDDLVDMWFSDETQAALRALVASLGK
ncbi:MAG: enoyl-CoA hydratase/isomerase family protein [Planctomycetota bacterium]